MFPPIVAVDYRKMVGGVDAQDEETKKKMLDSLGKVLGKVLRLTAQVTTDNRSVTASEDLTDTITNDNRSVAASEDLSARPMTDNQDGGAGLDNTEPVKSTPLSEGFQLFCKLAIELRLKIWEAALPATGSFTVHAVHTRQWPRTLYNQPELVLQSCRQIRGLPGSYHDSRPRNTAMLRACSESNQVYTARFPHKLPFDVCEIHEDGGCVTPSLKDKDAAFRRLHICDEDVIYLRNLDTLLRLDGHIFNSQHLVKPDPSWCFAVRKLRVNIDCLWGEQLERFSSLIDYFSCLERIEAVLDGRSWILQSNDCEKVVQIAREQLADDKGFDAEVPELVYLEPFRLARRTLLIIDDVSPRLIGIAT
ncbi:hypothetical protein BDZ45DRAFT_699179 [Acephala macrosclerotiorum]|nr:hypothetical protein BDZ45DRAFT_699179 [Acephala macrosclerotiorum]